MARRRKTKRRTTRKRTTRRSTKKKLLGYTKQGKRYALVYGSKSKPKLGKGRYSTLRTMKKALASGKAR